MVGWTIEHYTVIDRLGRGGMGEVYKARDMRLDRLVALKFLPCEKTVDSERRQRFIREAKAASALNHPNIVTVHDIGQTNGSYFISMEYVQGQTLDRLIPHRGMPVPDVLRYAVQISDALACAHHAGIVHRDLKPGNVMVTDRGLVKVVDFGLAKLTDSETRDESASTRTVQAGDTALTEDGQVVGTVAYMSPEQAEGKAVDARSDVFSMGCLLYEMLTGRRAFQGETKVRTLSAVLTQEPPPASQIAEDVPPELERIVSRCLRKEPARRFQHMDDLKVALEELKEESESGKLAPPPRPVMAVPLVRVTGHRALMTGVLLAVLITGGLFWSRLRIPSTPFQRIELQRLTTSGDVSEAAISPDGKYLARTSVHGEEQAIWLRQLSTASEVQVLPPAQVSLNGLQFSRDGAYLYFTQSNRPNESALYRVPSLGGPVQLVLDHATGPVAVSPDERQFAYLSSSPDKRVSIIVAGQSLADRRTIVTREEPDFLRYQLSWAPDNTLIAVPIGSTDDRYWQIERLMIVPLNGTSPVILSPVKWGMVWSAAWLPNARGLLVNGSAAQDSHLQIWFIPYPGGQPRPITHDLNDYLGVSTTADVTEFVTVQREQLGEMWITAPRAGTASQLTRTSGNGDGGGGIAWTPDEKLVYTSSPLAVPDLWIANADGTSPKRLTFGGVAIAPEIAANGRTIYFGSERSGACHIWRMDIDGSNASQVTHGRGEQFAAASPDGRWLVYESFSLTGPPSVWKMELPSGTPVRVGDLKSASAPSVSPDGQWLSISYVDERFQPPAGVGIIHLDGTGFQPLRIPPTWCRRWAPDGRVIYFVRSHQGAENVWKQAIAGGEPVQVTNFSSGSIWSLAVSRSERLAFRHFNSISDAVLVRSIR